MKRIKQKTVLLLGVIFFFCLTGFLGSLVFGEKKVYAFNQEAYNMSSLVTEEVSGGIASKQIADVSLVHGKWGEYQVFDGKYNATPDDEDQVYATDSEVQRGDEQGVSTYIKRYQLSATKNNDAVFKFEFKSNSKLYINHGTFGGGFDNNWATHGCFMIIQSTGDNAYIVKETPTLATTVNDMFSGEVNAKSGDTVYIIYRMKNATTVPGHEYANVFLDFTFTLKESDYVEAERTSVLTEENIYVEESEKLQEAYTMSSLVTEEVSGGIVSKQIADVSLVHGRWGEYQVFDGKNNATPDDEDKVYATDSVAQWGYSQGVSTYIKRYQLSATKRNDAVFKFEFKVDAKLYINHGTFGGDFDNNWATHGCFMIIQETDSNAYAVKETEALATTVNDMFSGEVNAKAGDIVYVIYRMKNATTVPGHEYANIFLDYTFTLKEGEYNDSERASILVDSNIYVDKNYIDDEKFTMSSIVSEVVRNRKVTRDVIEIELLHGVYGDYQEFDTFYNAIEEGGHDNYDQDKVSDSKSLAKNGAGMELATYFNRYKIGATTNNEAVIKFTAKENLKLSVSHGEGFWKNWATHARFYVIQEDSEGNTTNIMIKNIVSSIPSNYYSFEIDAKKGDVFYLIYRMVGETTIKGCEYANIGIDFDFDLFVNEYNETRRTYCFENSVEDFPYEAAGEPDMPLPTDIVLDKSENEKLSKGCAGGCSSSVMDDAIIFAVCLITACVIVALNNKRRKINKK
ncbi:MAG: hypothetical protein IJR66_03385 [Clostridia bacterium]|nr:hypothetical protein [Clostridia bacterium]MBQ9514002.1 hypothetical protein [Clostridia bacterium]